MDAIFNFPSSNNTSHYQVAVKYSKPNQNGIYELQVVPISIFKKNLGGQKRSVRGHLNHTKNDFRASKISSSSCSIEIVVNRLFCLLFAFLTVGLSRYSILNGNTLLKGKCHCFVGRF